MRRSTDTSFPPATTLEPPTVSGRELTPAGANAETVTVRRLPRERAE